MIEHREEIPAPAEPLKAEFLQVEGRPLSQRVELEFPFTYGGVTITAFEVRRLTVAQVEVILEALKSGAEVNLCEAMTTLPGGDPVPPGLFGSGVMIDDDDARLYEVAQSFLPRRLRRVLGLTLLSGADTSPQSQAD